MSPLLSELTEENCLFCKKFSAASHFLYPSVQKMRFLKTVLPRVPLCPENKRYLGDAFFFFFRDKRLILFLCERFRVNMFFKAARRIKVSGKGFCCFSCRPCHCRGFRSARAEAAAALWPVLAVCSSHLVPGGPCPPLSRAQVIHSLLRSSVALLFGFFFSPERSFSPLLISCRFWLLHK